MTNLSTTKSYISKSSETDANKNTIDELNDDQVKFYDGMPEEELERVLQISVTNSEVTETPRSVCSTQTVRDNLEYEHNETHQQFCSKCHADENEFEKSVQDVEDTISHIRQKLKVIADESDKFNQLTTQLIEKMRRLQQTGEDDFSVSYEQIYQFRSCLFETRRAFSEVPNFLDMIEHAWETDIYTAQTRQKYAQNNDK